MDFRLALVCASSPDPETRASGDQTLRSWEGQPGFYSNLWALIDSEADPKIKTLGLLYFKNGIDKYWRRNSRNGISEQEKQGLRPAIMRFFGLNDAKVLNTNHALIVAKISRYDYPALWPQLIDQLLEVVKSSFASGSFAGQVHSLYTLHLVIKTLSSRTLASSRAQLMSISRPILEFLGVIYAEFLTMFFQNISNQEAERRLEISLMCLKSCRRLLVYGFKDFTSDQMVLGFFQKLAMWNQELLKSRNYNAQLTGKIDKFILLIGKIYLDLQERDLMRFIFAPGLLEIISLYWKILQDSTPGQDSYFDKILLQSLILFRRLVKNSEFNIVTEDVQLKSMMKSAQDFVNSNVFTPEFCRSCLELLISRYLCLSKVDLEFWGDEPEQFVQEHEADHWEYNIRLCTEKLITDLVSEHKYVLAPVLLSMVEAASANQVKLPVKEAIYCAFGQCAEDLCDLVDFERFSESLLIKEASIKSPDLNIIRRQIALVIKNWISVKVSKRSRKMVYEALLDLSSDTDVVVKLTSMISLRQCVDDFDFELEDFMPFVAPAISQCLCIIEEYEEFESKLCILNTISVIVLRLESKCAPFAPQILNTLSSLWQSADSQHLFKSAIVSIVTSLISALGSEPFVLSVAIPIIHSALNVNDPSHIYLLDEGLCLCLEIVEKASTMTQQLFDLIPPIINLLDYGTESLKLVLKILIILVKLSPDNIFQQYGHALISKLNTLLGNLVPEASKQILNLLDTCIQITHPPSPLLLQEFSASAIIKRMIFDTIKDYNCILSRLILLCPDYFINEINAIDDSATILNCFLDQLISKFSSISVSNQKILITSALARLLPQCQAHQLQGIMKIFARISHEKSFSTSLFWDSDSIKSHLFQDRIEFNGFLRSRLSLFSSLIGVAEFNSLLATLDPIISESIKKDYLS